MLRDKTGRLVLSATDLSSFLSCHHRTALEMSVAKKKIQRPQYDDPQLDALFKRGLDHEADHVASLRSSGLSNVVDLTEVKDRQDAIARTTAAVLSGADVVVQGALGSDRWYGRPDLLQKTAAGYEVVDTKLARETKGGTVLQLALYSELLAAIQGHAPEFFHVVTPDKPESYRFDEYAAYYRLQRDRILAFAQDQPGVERDDILAAENYPEPVDHCDICAWAGQCTKRRRTDDHLSFVAGIGRSHRRELTRHAIETMKALAEMAIEPLSFKPKRGAPETFVRVREQARVQVQARTNNELVYELLPIVLPTEKEAGQGLCRLPEPTAGDLFLDLEGDPFVGPTSGEPMLRGREYLFGVVKADGSYSAFWAESAEQEKAAFEAVMDLISAAKAKHPGMHVYHYAAYEQSAFKRLMGRHATREQEMDAFLRSETFVDLYRVVREALRAGVERYSIKNMEPFYQFVRDVDLKDARRHLQAMELAVEANLMAELKPEVKIAVEGYNRDDCVSTLRLRDWLESLRADMNVRTYDGQMPDGKLPRPELKSGDASEPLKDRQQKVEGLRGQLLGKDDEARRLLAYLLDFHRREDKAGWWEYFRLLELTDEQLLDEPGAAAGLQFIDVVERVKKSQVQRYSYPLQEMEMRRGDSLKLKDQKVWGELKAIDRTARTIDVLVGPSKADIKPTSAFAHDHIKSGVIENAIFTIGEGVVNGAADPLALELLNRRPPKTRDVLALEGTVLAVQGPPGTGKTYTGGRMICDLIAAGKKVGIAATGHKVIANLLDSVRQEAAKRSIDARLGHKRDGNDDDDGTVFVATDNAVALDVLVSGKVNVLGGTAWLWSRPEFAKSVDVLFVDEAGQVPLANALAMTAGAKALVLLGDPQQLDHPGKGTHPEGVGVSALEHYLGQHKTMPAELGMFLADTWRFGSAICDFISEVFYERKLKPTQALQLDRQRLDGGPISGAGLFVVDVEHEGNRNGSDEEVDAVGSLIQRFLAAGSTWTNHEGLRQQIAAEDILVVSPYNVQVSRLRERLDSIGVEVGTVDKFQGKQAPIVIYSMATSSPEDAPRGMDFLYSLNRLNVAVSRAKCAAIIVANPQLFEPECKTPKQIRLANALCRFREMAKVLTV
jgi:predicted RecB family nuclease